MSKKIKILISIIVLILGSIGVTYFFTREDKDTALTVSDKRWIEENRNNVIDFATLNSIPIVSDNGDGLIFDFLTSLEENTKLEFNKLSYEQDDNQTYQYLLTKKDKVNNNDLLLYQDHYVLVTKDNKFYTKSNELANLNIGVINNDLKQAQDYLKDSLNLTYKTYENYTSELEALNNGEVNAIVLPRLDYLEEILKNDLSIAYNITEYKINYVITLGDNKKLNNILTKYFNKWESNNYEEAFRTYLANTYFTYKEVPEKDQTEFKSRRYTYGFVENPPFDIKINGSLKGFNHTLINDFAKSAGIEIDYKQYSSLENLHQAFENGEIDLLSGNIDQKNLKGNKTISIYNNQIVIVSKENTNLTINNISSLKGQTVVVIKGSQIAKTLKQNDVKIKEYDNIKDIINNIKLNELAAIDEYTYDYYVRSDLKEYKEIGTLDIKDNYGFISKKDNNLEKIHNYFNFYLSFVNYKEMINQSYNQILLSNNNIKSLQVILSCLVIVLLAIAAIITKFIFSKKKNINSKLSKTDKLRYVDNLTSLKNRNYLNDNISTWDNSEAYPQSVIVIDLNNVAYINDNFGHAEGDKVIVEAASILINNQLSGSEILRTNGNEFLIFSIGHDEKSVVTYIRKLNKEFKELSHGFGAAIGYSMITDEIKTIDDAINEATIDMRSNKEEVKS